MNHVLLLNKNESVLNIIGWQDAVCLYVTKKAECPYGYDDFYDIKMVNGVFKLPTALVLYEYVNIPYKSAQLTKGNVLKRDKYICGYCDIKLTNSSGSVDHVVPKSRWSEFLKAGRVKERSYNNWKNVISACKKCNCRKDNKTPEEARMKLQHKPFIPSREFLVMRGIDNKTRTTWERWIKKWDDLE
jgi:5-methylcytosine-specific restriction endonuclease McrA